MFRRLPLWVLLLSWVLCFAVLIFFGALVRSGMRSGAAVTGPAKLAVDLASVPSLARELLRGEQPWESRAGEPVLPAGFSRDARFSDDGFLLISHYSPEQLRNVVDLVRAGDGKLLRRYAPDIAAINRRSAMRTPLLNLERDKSPQRYRMTHPVLMADGGLVFQDMSPLVRVDACGRVAWTLKGIFHHAVEQDRAGNLWTAMTVLSPSVKHVSAEFHEDAVVEISPSGKILSQASVIDILERNGLTRLWRGRPYSDDPFHLNDVQPVALDGAYWKAGDLFLSFRHLSLIALYRPSTGKILWYRQGPWSLQHDVNILDDHRITVFDNNAGAGASSDGGKVGEADFVQDHNRLLTYDFATDAIASPFEQAFAQQRIHTVTEGRGQVLKNGDLFVEETNFGRLLRLDPQGRVRWRYISADTKGARYILGWSRYLGPENSQAVARAVSAPCG